MKKIILAGTIAGLLTVAAQAQNASITWGSVSYVSGASDVVTSGTLVGTWSPYLQQNSGASPITVNGVSFVGDSLTGLSTPSYFSSQSTSMGSPGTSDSGYNTLLTGAQYGGSAGNSVGGDFVFGGLTSGRDYEVQIWAENLQSLSYRQWENFYAGPLSYPTDASGAVTYPTDGSALGQFVTGTFTATSSTEQINEQTWSSGTGAYSGPQVNLFQLRDITPVPEPSTLAFLAGGGLMMLWTFRRRA